jgi:hypothetical protein
VNDRRDPLLALSHERHRAPRHLRELHRTPVLVDPRTTLGQPERELEARVAERSSQRVADSARLDALELDGEPTDRSTSPSRREHACQQGQQNGDGRDEPDVVDRRQPVVLGTYERNLSCAERGGAEERGDDQRGHCAPGPARAAEELAHDQHDEPEGQAQQDVTQLAIPVDEREPQWVTAEAVRVDHLRAPGARRVVEEQDVWDRPHK